MTAQEAIKIIKAAQAEVEWECPLDYATAFDMAIEALEKQIPLKHLPYEMGQDGSVLYPCGNCGEDVKGSDYFPWCGQKVGSE